MKIYKNKGKLDVCKYLVSKGCDPNKRMETGETAIYFAAQEGR